MLWRRWQFELLRPTGSSSTRLGYTDADLAAVPDGADLGRGRGNPQAIAGLQPGERVLDLGSGGGFDAFLAARQVGPTGHVVGVDMTPEMIVLACGNAAKVGLDYVDFRLGTIEQLPVEDASIDVMMSNCVINLAPDKPAVFREAYRLLACGGRLAISDMVAVDDLPAGIANDPAAYTPPRPRDRFRWELRRRSSARSGTRAVEEARLWLVGYGEWTGYTSATLIGVGRTARSTVEQIDEVLARGR